MMAGKIFRKVGVLLLMVLKGIMYLLLFIFKAALAVLKAIVLVFAMIVRILLVFVGISVCRE